jgi:hypothetical protein
MSFENKLSLFPVFASICANNRTFAAFKKQRFIVHQLIFFEIWQS